MAIRTSAKWAPDSWRGKPIRQMPDYPDQAALKAVEAKLKGFPPLVFAGESRALKAALAKVAEGKAVAQPSDGLDPGNLGPSTELSSPNPRLDARLELDGR